MSTKCSRREKPPSSSSSEEEDPQTKRIDRCPVLLGKNVDLASFTFDVHSFHIEDLFVYLIRSLLRLEDGVIRLYTTKTIPHTEEYNLLEACRRVIGKHFDTLARLSTNQLTLTCRVLHNIIAHIIVPRKRHHDEVNHYDVFILDSIILGRKLDFPYIMIQHMNSFLSGTRPKTLPYGMILTKVFEHFGVSVHDSVVLLPKDTDTINISTLKRMKIFKEDGQWVAKSKRFDDESGLFTLPFEDGVEMDEDEDEDEPLLRPHSQRPSSSTFSFTEDHFNLLNGRIDSLTSSVEGLHHTVKDLRITMGTLQQSVDRMTSLLQALHSCLDAMIPPSPPPDF
ncbi:Uncharacterized protein Adt_28209 [Abeliophyllum distichum]|uniref:Putative plant transposon protein domain-containing protein n=1 Tax=Abeliophyllum distichum TaxID=126358 RepID=A0ABD1RVW1_9LAMI